MKKKTDNAHLADKVAIRRWLLRLMNITDAYVLDTTSGTGQIWTAMEDHVNIRQWTRCDEKPRQNGVLAINSTEALARLSLEPYNVIDIDPYGEPWESYLTALQRITKPTAIFVTRGHKNNTTITQFATETLGMPASWEAMLPCKAALVKYADEQMLAETHRHGTILHAGRIAHSRVSYYAIGFSPSQV